MAHGTPDWGVTAGAQTVYQLTDLAELAVRLGSPITHDRRGDVLWWDDFEWTFNKWASSLGGTGAAAAISVARARNGRCSVLLTAGSDGNHNAIIQHSNPMATLSLLGVEVSFSPGSAFSDLDLFLARRDGVTETDFGLRWDVAAASLQYLDAAGVWQNIATGISLLVGATTFHTLKLVADPATGAYVRAILNERTFSLAGITGNAFASATTPQVMMEIDLTGRAGFNDTCYVDDAIITQNEPV